LEIAKRERKSSNSMSFLIEWDSGDEGKSRICRKEEI
jgi:hypothetical protein